LRLFLILVIASCASVAHGEVVVIVSSKSTITSLTPEQTARIFLGKDDKFPNDETAIPIDQPEGDDTRDEFYLKVARKTASQMASYWSKLIFTGEGKLSQTVKGDKEIIKFIAGNPSAIGYIDKRVLLDKHVLKKSIRVVLTP
jgi:ABC-type phosphate transport system substrate-binding protein